jgi:spore germination protein
MDEKKQNENYSSGAEKVERIARAAEQERLAAERRVQQAKMRMQEKAEAQKAYRQNRSQGENGGSGRHENGSSNGDNGGKKRGDGLGGWIAAVVSLGAVTLILSAVVTVGAIRMGQDNASSAGSYRGTVYEFIHIVEQVDDDLGTLRISESPSKQAELLTNILVQTRMAEADLEKLPFDTQSDENTMRFLNDVSHFCESALGKLSRGESLSEWDKRQVENLYRAQHEMRKILDEVAACVEDKDVTGMMKGKESCITDAMQSLENALATNPLEQPKEPRENMPQKPAKKEMKDRAGISSQKAEELCKYYFSDYSIVNTVYGGESLGKGLKAYNFTMTTDNGVEIFAEIAQENGALVYFDYYEECNRHVHDIESAKNTAQEFLAKFGYENMIPVRVDESGTNADFTFAYSVDGCTYYPDEIVVKVCEERGIVSGLNASKFLKNHRDRYALNANITMQEACDGLSDKLTVESSKTVLFEHNGKEVLAYEFFCSYDGKLYFIYVDAMDGRELFIVDSKAS